MRRASGPADEAHRASTENVLAIAELTDRLRRSGCVFAEEEARLLLSTGASGQDLETMARRRVAGEPLEQILGWVSFCGRRIKVAPGVFVPRRRTEYLAELASKALADGMTVVELCCGVAAAGLVVASSARDIQLFAVDIDPAAVAVATQNLAAVGGVALEGDLYGPLPSDLCGAVDLLLANAPYVPTEEIAMMPPEAREHEAWVALDGGPDGLEVQRRVVASAAQWLKVGGRLYVETSRAQSEATAALMAHSGLLPQVLHDIERDATVVIGMR